MDRDFLIKAIELASNNIDIDGGPFGAVVVKNNEIISAASNRVTANNDPTAHAEVEAIRLACKNLGTYDLSGCTIYASCEPCPMCLGAIYWSRLDKVVYASGRKDAEKAGFDDNLIYEELARLPQERNLRMIQMDLGEAGEVFEKWRFKSDKKPY